MFNHLFSLGIDIGWRKEAAKEAMIDKSEFKVLDLATGTGDLALAINKQAKRQDKKVYIVGTDFNKPMLNHAKQKSKGISNMRFAIGDALDIKYPDSSFDVITTAFSLRNFDNLGTFSKEMKRVLKKGGKFVLLDMARPENNQVFTIGYFKVISFVGSSVNPGAYRWLTSSIWAFDKQKMVSMLKKHGFKDIKLRNLRSGIAFIITGRKP